VAPLPFLGGDSLDRMRFRFIVLISITSKFVSIISLHFCHHPLSLIFFHQLPSSTPAYFLINEGNPSSITPLLSSLNSPLWSSPPNATPDFGLSVLDYN
jgi:hypothetical protein